MSNSQNTYFDNENFVSRFIELCGTSRPAEVARFLDISYQASKNYLKGRLPDTQTLIHIATKTNCSIDWLLLGTGEKNLATDLPPDTVQLSDQLRSLIRKECEEVFAGFLNNQNKISQEKVFVLNQKDIKEETVIEPTSDIPLKKD